MKDSTEIVTRLHW